MEINFLVKQCHIHKAIIFYSLLSIFMQVYDIYALRFHKHKILSWLYAKNNLNQAFSSSFPPGIDDLVLLTQPLWMM